MIMIDSDMPDNCAECRLSIWDGEGYVCPFSGIPALNIGRQVDCPLIEPEQQWIPVSERLPKVGKSVMITFVGGSVAEGVYKGFDGHHHVWHQYRWSATCYDYEVLAWMPLPEPFK